jgi:Uma2 family endonuclease
MAEAGVLSRDARVELIDGQLIDMPPIGSAHAAVVDQLGDLLHDALAARAIVRRQQPVLLDEHSAPQPDLAVAVKRDDYYRRSHPHARDVLLVVEVSDSTLAFDRDVKGAWYARAGIPELWLVDIDGAHVTRLASPSNGAYLESTVFGAHDSLAFTDVRIPLRAIFSS